MIALHSPDALLETGLRMCPPEKSSQVEAIDFCELYLQDYRNGKQDAYKFLRTALDVHQVTEETIKLLMKLHDFPNFPSR